MEYRKTMLLTGASRGIGHATVKHFSAAGWRVLTASRHPFDADCPWPEGSANHIQLDLAESDLMEQGIQQVRDLLEGSRLDAIVNNAGISPKGTDGARMGVLQTDWQTWSTVLNVNLLSTALLARGLFSELKRAKGIVVNVTSIAGSRVHPFAGVAYAASKAALSALTREMAHEFGPHGIRVNAIAPGEIDTSILSAGTSDIVKNDIPMHRLGKPEEVAATIYFLCTAGAGFINGAEIHINGGQHV